MSVASQAIRARRKARIDPRYSNKRTSKDIAAKRLADLVQREMTRKARKGSK